MGNHWPLPLSCWMPAARHGIQPASPSYTTEPQNPEFTDSREMPSSCKGHLSTQELGGCVSLCIELDSFLCCHSLQTSPETPFHPFSPQ